MPEDPTPLEEFPSPRDRTFGDLVIEMGLADRRAIEECLALQVRYAFAGKEVPSLPQILVGKEMITAKQAERALGKFAERASGESPALVPDADFSDTTKHLPALDDVGSLVEGPRIIMPASALKEPDKEREVIEAQGPAEEPAPQEPPVEVVTSKDTPTDKIPEAEVLAEVAAAEGAPAPDEIAYQEHPLGDLGAAPGKKVSAEPEPPRKGKSLPPVPRIEHAPDTGTQTVEIIMPTGEGAPVARAPKKAAPAPHPVPATPPSSAEPISGYKLLARLSADETGTIFKAKQVAMDRLVALKVLPPKSTQDRSFVDRFLKEARDAGQLNHPNLVRVHEVGRTGSYYFYSMELVQGQTLEENIKLGGRMEAARALQVTMEICKAVEHMESKGLLHGEISPESVVVTTEGAVKLLLAGLGRALKDNTRFLMGDRYHYVAPERALSGNVDVRADLYSAGAVLHYALSGQHPYTGSNANEVLSQHFSAPVPNPKEVLSDLAADVAKVVTRAMAKNRTERFGSPAEMIAAVEAAQAILKPRRTHAMHKGTRAASRTASRRPTRHTTTGAAAVRLKRRRRRRRRR